MADDDEIDVLGDFNLDNLLSKTETGIYDYDYPNHPQWILEHTNTNSTSWFHQNTTIFENSLPQAIETCITESNDGQLDNTIDPDPLKKDSIWTENEKLLFQKALEIFGRSTVRISQFIGSKTPAQVKHYMKTYTETAVNTSFTNLYDGLEYRDGIEDESVLIGSEYPALNMSEVIVESQIPASIEEVIASVSTAQPTIQNVSTKHNHKPQPPPTKLANILGQKRRTPASNKTKFSKKVTISNIPCGQSVLKTNLFKRNLKKKVSHSWNNVNRKKPSMKDTCSNKKITSTLGQLPKKNTYHKSMLSLSGPQPKSDLELVTGKGLSVSISSTEEVIRIQKNNDDSDSDVEIDIEDENEKCEPSKPRQEPKTVVETIMHDREMPVDDHKQKNSPPENDNEPRTYLPFDSQLDPKILEKFASEKIPTEEFIIQNEIISEEEICFNYEFFYGRGLKTPDRYIKIRTHILNAWYMSKPVYVSKTSIRSGLKNCGDVNSIGRVHLYLEQIGAINFGCEQTNYIRPLSKILPFFSTAPPSSENKKKVEKLGIACRSENRQRHKKKLPSDGEGGYTLTHNEHGDIIETTVVTQESNPKSRGPRHVPVKLICCKNFTEDIRAPYKINLHISALLSMDWHAHTSHSEVMGLLGGTFNISSNLLSIRRYVPCQSATNSATHCDMCPVSQSTAYEILQAENLNVIGWFHSHPTFSPNPSQQDLETQLNMQRWYSKRDGFKPFVGLILSPFSTYTNCLVSDYRCLIIKQINLGDEMKQVPYKFNVDITCDRLNTAVLIANAREIFKKDTTRPTNLNIEFFTPYFQNPSITYIDKMIASTKMHLAKCREINKMTCDLIVEGITELSIPQ